MMALLEPFLSDLGLTRRVPRRSGSVVKHTGLSALSSIHDPTTAMVVAERTLPTELPRWLSAWVPHAPHVDTKVNADADLSSLFRGLPPGPLRDWLEADVRALVRAFASVTETSRFRIVAGPVFNDSCRRFHIDHLRLRLITTYLGPGTEWADEGNVDFTALDHPESCDCENPPSLVRDFAKVRHAKAGDVLLMKGDLYSNDVRGQVHRSPPIEGTSLTRYVVVLTLPGRFS